MFRYPGNAEPRLGIEAVIEVKAEKVTTTLLIGELLKYQNTVNILIILDFIFLSV